MTCHNHVAEILYSREEIETRDQHVRFVMNFAITLTRMARLTGSGIFLFRLKGLRETQAEVHKCDGRIFLVTLFNY